jgi:ABC-type antimicrobial peptide transport system permease subunit
MLKDLCRAGIEGMTDMSGSGSGRREIYKEVIASILSLMIAILIVAFVGKWLWNNSVAELFTFARPVRSVWQIIALMLFLALIR